MRSVARWSVEHRVTVNLLMIFVIVVGLLALKRMKREVFPQFSLDLISVQVTYLGASPEEIEEGIIVKIEEKVKSIEGIKKIISTAREGYGTVLLELKEDVHDVQKVVFQELLSHETALAEYNVGSLINYYKKNPSLQN